MDLKNIIEKIKNTQPYISGWKQMKKSAVIIPIVEIDNELCILFEVRSKKLTSQPGDICFPGGKMDKEETPKETALRELDEELGIKNINIVNELDLVIRPDGMIIHPFLGIIKNVENIEISQNEVDHIFYVPLDYLLNTKPLEITNKLVIDRSKDFPYELIVNKENYKFKEGKYVSLFYKYNDYVIWGITAEILRNFLEKL